MIESKNLIQELKAQNTKLKAQNKQLKKTKRSAEVFAYKLDLFSNFSPNGLFIIDCDNKIIDINKSGLSLLSKKRSELNSLTFNQFITEKYNLDFKIFLLKTKEKNSVNYCEIELTIDKDKHVFVRLTAKFIEKEQQYLIITIDETEKEFFKKKLQENESVFKEIQRIGHVGSYQFNISTNSLELSQELRFIFGVQNNTPLNIMETWLNIVHPLDREIMELCLRKCILNKTSFRKEYRIIRLNDGAVRWLDGWGEISYDNELDELSMIGVIQDITERKLALEKIQSAETRSHQIFEASKEGILILDAITGQITDANPFLIELIGFNYDELVGKELWEIGVFKNIATSKETFIELQNKEYIRFEDMPLETKAGTSIDVEFVSNVYMVDTRKVILCHIRDISDRKKADKALQESAQLYYAMFEKNQTPQLLIDPINGNIIDVNSAAARFYGYSLKDFRLMTLSDISTFSSEHILEEMKKFTLTGPSYFEFIHKLASGETCDIEIYTSPLSINGQALLISTINDISKRKLEEERLVQLNNKLEEVNILKSQFISTVSHEFRTPLAGILSSVQLLQIYNDTWGKEKKEKQFKQIFDAVQHTKALLDDVSLIDEEQTSKSFFRPTNIKLLPLINEIIEENLSVSETNQKVIIKSKLDIESYYMDSIMIRHILNNIISNALKYSSKNITIHLSKTKKKEVKFIIKDLGIGIPTDEIKYLLEPYYRASNKGSAQGTGFGLSVVKRFVDLHKGKMLIESVVNEGTAVIIILPYLQQ
ncbi:PAS domain S-box protein [Polaribacter sp. PL03]|uniref:PAS domain S-box protein n=1 Tax=Polaribacter sp. PL03 TaxID=3088353 RepID=UPI0029D13FCF|nr:PAS domain S-box protein [Polaribacter sp. PL03]MDX6747469.1 PAS domain S-box protein [Polaribacter sp. PL03]